MKNIVDAKWLYENRDSVILVDATNNFMDPEEGKQKYIEGHIAGAFHIDLRDDMCGPLAQHGGRDPMPESMEHFKNTLESFGIGNDSKIVVYDEDLVPSSRFWWMCKYMGLEDVKVLNAGINGWKKAGYPVTADPTAEPSKKGKIEINIHPELYADINYIRGILDNPNKNLAIIDSRSEERHKGIIEPIDKIGGHIPGAFNYFYGLVVDPETGYKDLDFLKDHYKGLEKYDELIVHCGSGVSGSVNIIAMDEIGLKSRFYVGSWSDYISYEDSKIIVEK